MRNDDADAQPGGGRSGDEQERSFKPLHKGRQRIAIGTDPERKRETVHIRIMLKRKLIYS